MTTLQDLVNNFYQKSSNAAISDDEAQQMLDTIKASNNFYVKFDLINQLLSRYENILIIKSEIVKFEAIINLLKAINNRWYVDKVNGELQITELGKSKLQPLFDKALQSLN